MLYLESPAGVGFSYSVNQTFYSSVNDAMTARDNLVFLRRWFVKFPQYKQRDFFIAGESYAGHYVPQLARLIIRSKVNFNLKGIAIGNPLLEFNTDLNARDHFYWSHGLISDSTYQLLTSVCNNSKLIREAIARSVSTACFGVYTLVQQEVSDSIDPYDVTGDVCLSSNHSQLKIFNQQLVRPRLPNLSPQVLEVDSIKQQQQVMGKVDVCLEEETTKYLNRKDVQMALHARLVGVTSWHVCSMVLDYDISDEEIPTIHAVRSLVKSGLAVLVYSGDQDSVIPFTGTRSLVSKVAKDLRLKTTVPYRAWLSGNQIGGWTQVYGDNLSFATIRGASHTAPSTQPKRSLLLFKAFLENKPLPTA
ncbi:CARBOXYPEPTIDASE [Salix viminalis]|uniref:Carboxypeptidase n=1 Tax=Salix viminalis TaxID=40686 RepID=A0A9Q0V3U5_SALVM|nr:CARBOXYPEPTIDASE [Salix viminalis]